MVCLRVTFLFQLYMAKLSNPSAILLETGHARENIDKFTAKGEGKAARVAASVRYSDGSVAHRLKSERLSLKWIDNLRLENSITSCSHREPACAGRR